MPRSFSPAPGDIVGCPVGCRTIDRRAAGESENRGARFSPGAIGNEIPAHHAAALREHHSLDGARCVSLLGADRGHGGHRGCRTRIGNRSEFDPRPNRRRAAAAFHRRRKSSPILYRRSRSGASAHRRSRTGLFAHVAAARRHGLEAFQRRNLDCRHAHPSARLLAIFGIGWRWLALSVYSPTGFFTAASIAACARRKAWRRVKSGGKLHDLRANLGADLSPSAARLDVLRMAADPAHHRAGSEDSRLPRHRAGSGRTHAYRSSNKNGGRRSSGHFLQRFGAGPGARIRLRLGARQSARPPLGTRAPVCPIGSRSGG